MSDRLSGPVAEMKNAAEAADAMSWIGLDGVQEGTFELKKRIRDDEA